MLQHLLLSLLICFYYSAGAAVTIGVDDGRHEGGKIIMKRIMAFLVVLSCQILFEPAYIATVFYIAIEDSLGNVLGNKDFIAIISP